MAITMKEVRDALDPEEPDYGKAAALGPEALPHLEALVASGDPMLASKATYLASLIEGERSAEVVEKAARSSDPIVRVAAAAAAANLVSPRGSEMLRELAADADPGVRKVAQSPRREQKGAPRRESDRTDTRASAMGVMTGRMPGEQDLPSGSGPSTMPGEKSDPGTSGMPGERKEADRGLMPGEQSGSSTRAKGDMTRR